MSPERKTAAVRPLPIWLMGFGFAPLGASGAVILYTIPQLLAANHVSEPTIASITATAIIPGFMSFFLSPILDWRFSRRVYAIAFALLAAISLALGLLCLQNLPLLTALLFFCNTAANLCAFAVAGWFGNATAAEHKAGLGAWFTAFNIGGFGLVAAVAIDVLRDLPYALGAAILGLSVLAALPLFIYAACPPADGRLAKESFAAFSRDVIVSLRRPAILWTLLLFLAPATAFALTNTLGGLGAQFHASERLVAVIGGVGAAVAGVAASLSIPPLIGRIAPRPLYLWVGAVGALFTLSLIALPHTPATFALAILGENAFQAAAFAVANTIILRTMGVDNPLAATQFGLLNGAASVPLSYMQAIDGHFYGRGGVTGSYLADALISGGACLALALLLWRFRRQIPAV
jgi:PAT family beta-lactamase induction signal transducer AmpG